MNRRGFLAKILASAVAAPAVTKLIAGGAPTQEPKAVECVGCSGVADWWAYDDKPIDSHALRVEWSANQRAYVRLDDKWKGINAMLKADTFPRLT